MTMDETLSTRVHGNCAGVKTLLTYVLMSTNIDSTHEALLPPQIPED
jgi:hypothetical protein